MVRCNNAANASRSFQFLSFSCVFIVLCVILSVSGQEAETVKVTDYDHETVMEWLEEQGDWARAYKEIFEEQRIDGKRLVSLDQNTLEELGISSSIHRSFFVNQITLLKSNGFSFLQQKNDPNVNDYWSLRSRDRKSFTVLTIGLFNSPRLTTLYVYLYEYDTIFKPFFETTKTGVSFWTTWLLLPRAQIATSSLKFFEIHPFLTSIVLIGCLMQTFIEIVTFATRKNFKDWIVSSLTPILFGILFPFIPWILCDLYFFILVLFFIPLSFISTLIQLRTPSPCPETQDRSEEPQSQPDDTKPKPKLS